MPDYTFKLRDDGGGIADDSVVSLPNDEAAYGYACDVARELLQGRDGVMRHWALDILTANGNKVSEILFAEVDPSLEHLRAELRVTVNQANHVRRSFKDASFAAAQTKREAKALLARSRGKPYLAADSGRKIIRDDP
jgi:hypothetical protein